MFFDRVLRVENVGPGKTALIQPALNATYDKFIFNLGGGLVAANLSELRVYANDVEIFKDTGPNLDLRQAYAGIDTDAAEVTLDFTEPNARGAAAEQYLSSLPANLLKKLIIQCDIAAGANAGSTLDVDAEYRGPTSNPFVKKRRQFISVLAAAGDHDLFLPSGISGGIIQRLWLHESTAGRITAAQLKVGGIIAQYWRTMTELTRVQERNGMVPQNGVRVLDFVCDGNLQGALNTTSGAEVSLRLTASAAVTITGFIDYIDPISRVK